MRTSALWCLVAGHEDVRRRDPERPSVLTVECLRCRRRSHGIVTGEVMAKRRAEHRESEMPPCRLCGVPVWSLSTGTRRTVHILCRDKWTLLQQLRRQWATTQKERTVS